MKIYFAGNCTKEQAQTQIDLKVKKLFSYFYVKDSSSIFDQKDKFEMFVKEIIKNGK